MKSVSFPLDVRRPRRLRAHAAIRGMVRESSLSPEQFIMPLFVEPGENIRRPIASMPGQYRYSVDRLPEAIDALLAAGVQSVILFGIPEHKDATGTDSLHEGGIVQRALRMLRNLYPELYLITDVCLCEYTDHGHCGVFRDGTVVNDETLPLLQQQAVSHAEAGAHMVAPSGMMDGAVAAIRAALEQRHSSVALMSYAVKYASAYYGPFREAAESAPQEGNRKGYQMDPANSREALREALLDQEQGADIIMVKPALAYLDVIQSVRAAVDVPVACYNVSGEYSMIKAAGAAGLIDEDAVILESLLAMKRAGADIIITYFAEHAARLLNA